MRAAFFSAAAVLALGACATHTAEAPVSSPCYERTFDVYFEQLDADLSPEAREAIGAVSTALEGCHVQHVRIIGLAGAPGPTDANQELSERRAQVIADYLVRVTPWPRSIYELRAAGEEGATNPVEELPRPMRRRGHITVTAVAP